MYLVLYREKSDPIKFGWTVHGECKSHSIANDWVLGAIRKNVQDGELGKYEYIITKVWTTYKACGA